MKLKKKIYRTAIRPKQLYIYGILCDCEIPMKLKGKLYMIVIRPTQLYRSDY